MRSVHTHSYDYSSSDKKELYKNTKKRKLQRVNIPMCIDLFTLYNRIIYIFFLL